MSDTEFEKSTKLKKDNSTEGCNESTLKTPVIFPFTIYDHKEKYILIALLSSIGFWSTVSSPIYFPALPVMEEDFKVTATVSNLSVVAYLVFQGLMPAFSSNLADYFGRRPIIIVSMIGFVATCIGLSQANVYWLIVVLRCVQAAAIGPVIAISSGVSGDVCTLADRGGFVGTVAGLQLLGNAIGGLIGAALIQRFTWRAIFVFLAIGCGVTVILVILILPETIRAVVGNGTVVPKLWINTAPIFLLGHYKKRLTNDLATLEPSQRLDILSPLKILLHKEMMCVLIAPGIKFACWTMVLTSLNLLGGDGYHYSVMKIGLIYLPQGILCLLGSLVSGKFLNVYYNRRRAKYDEKYSDVPEVNRPKFNVLKTRVHVSIPSAFLHFIGLVIFGWCLQYKQNIASIIISTCMVSYASSSFIAICTTIAVDLHPSKASTAASCMNLVRCLLAALGAGVISQMTSAMGLGGCYTFWAGIGVLGDLLLLYAVRVRTQRA